VENCSQKLTQSRRMVETQTGKENSQPVPPSISAKIDNRTVSTAPNTRFSHELSHSSRLNSPRRMTELEQQFKSIAISQETFIKTKKESPELYYDIKEKIGEGSFGQVFRAVHRKTQEERAIKVLKVRLMREEKRK
jgi:hypothetical protein